MNRTQFVTKLLYCLLFSAIGVKQSAAEGGCPQGMYPLRGQGITGCAPMGGVTQPGGASAAGRWLKTWGVVADSRNGIGAPVTGGRSRADAARRALDLARRKEESVVRLRLLTRTSAWRF